VSVNLIITRKKIEVIKVIKCLYNAKANYKASTSKESETNNKTPNHSDSHHLNNNNNNNHHHHHHHHHHHKLSLTECGGL
jgi:hypothetical protein